MHVSLPQDPNLSLPCWTRSSKLGWLEASFLKSSLRTRHWAGDQPAQWRWQRQAGRQAVPSLVCVSNLWYCMFWAGKRGRRSSAGSLESNVEVSRKYPVWLAVLCRPILGSLSVCPALPSPAQTGRHGLPCPSPLRACGFSAFNIHASHRLFWTHRWGWLCILCLRFAYSLYPVVPEHG